MTIAKVVETSVNININSSSQDSTILDDLHLQTCEVSLALSGFGATPSPSEPTSMKLTFQNPCMTELSLRIFFIFQVIPQFLATYHQVKNVFGAL